MIVPDASVILEVLLRSPVGARAEERLWRDDDTLHAPHVIDLEVAQVLRRFTLRDELSERRGRMALELMARFPIARYPHDALLPRIWALRNNCTAYDAAYIALAEALDATLLTCDERLAGAAGHRADIELI